MTLAGKANRDAGDGEGDEVAGVDSSAGEETAMAAALAVADDIDEAVTAAAGAGGATPWPNCRAQTARSPPSMVVV